MASPARVLAIGSVYPPHHLGGYEIIWQGVMRQLRADGHVARVLTTQYRNPEVGDDRPDEPDTHRELDWYWRNHSWRRLDLRETLELERFNADVFARHCRELKPDVITFWPVGGMSLGLIEQARRAGIPAVLFMLDQWLSYGREHDLWMRRWSRLRPLAPAVARVTGLPTRVDYARAGHWVFCSRALRSQVLATGLPLRNGTVLTPGVERDLLAEPREPEPPPWAWRLLYVGRVVEQKAVGRAIEALARLPDRARLRIVGDGDDAYRARLAQLAQRLGVAERVEFEPAVPRARIAEIYRGADAVVFPVEWLEPWGLVPLEAMALGRPVVATGRGGSADYLVHGENSLLFPAGDAGALAAAVVALAEDPDLRGRLRHNGYTTAAAHTEDAFNRQAVGEILAARLA